MPDLPDLAALLTDPASVPVDQIPTAIAELEKMKAMLYARLAPPLPNGHPQRPDAPYTLREAAALMRKSPVWLRRRAKAGGVPGARKYGKAWVFEREPFDRYRARREVS